MFHLIVWDMQTDKFEFGSWFYGRIYEDRCDLSPDGRYFVYFAANQTRHTWEKLGSNAWTAICQPPWLKAITFEVSCCGTWGGGGRFVTADDPEFSAAKPVEFLGSDVRLTGASSRQARFVRSAKSLVENADWTGLDHRNRLIYVIAGQLWRCQNTRGNYKTPQLIADFTDVRPPNHD